MDGIKKTFDTVEELTSIRLEAKKNILQFGNAFLDDAMRGILKNDLVLVGARSGAGKTQFCVNVALANVKAGKRVYFLALEAERKEIEMRLLFQLFSKLFYQNLRSMREMGITINDTKWGLNINYQDFILGDYDSLFPDLFTIANDDLASFSNLKTYYKEGDFALHDFMMKILEIADETDLIIVDHVHYFDYDDENENKSIKEIAKTARTLALEVGKPIILVSHLRKADKYAELCPGLEEFHGSSDLFKIATKAITLAPGAWDPTGRLQTFMRIVKNRYDGSVTRVMASIGFNINEGRYEDFYKIGDSSQKRDSGFEALDPISYPKWARLPRNNSRDNIKNAERLPNYAPKPGR